MKTKYLNIGKEDSLDNAINLLLLGEIVAIPTETVYGLGICYNSNEGFKKLCDIKKRNPSKSIAICLDSYESIKTITTKVPEPFWELAKRFLPGPLTIVFSLGKETIGIRVPKHQLCQKIIQRTGPLYVTSANYANEPALTDPLEIYQAFKGLIAAVLTDNTRSKYSMSSTVVQILDSGDLQLLRKGPIPWSVIKKIDRI